MTALAAAIVVLSICTGGAEVSPVLAPGSGIPCIWNDYQACLTVTTNAMLTMATDADYILGVPEHFTIVHECSTQNGRFIWDGVTPGQGTAADWKGFVDAVAGQLRTNGYTGKIGAGGCLYWEDDNTVVGGNTVPNFCGDSFNGDSNLDYVVNLPGYAGWLRIL